jgi:hypothetical protein
MENPMFLTATAVFAGLTALPQDPRPVQLPPDDVVSPQGNERPADAPGAPSGNRTGRDALGPPPPGFGSAGFVQVNVDAGGGNIPGDAANEPSLAVDPTAPNRMTIGWRQFDTTA